MYTGVLYQNCTRNFFRSIGYTIGNTSKIYEDNQATIKGVLADIITPQARPLDVLITAIRELHLRKTFEIVDKRSYMQISDHNSKPHGGNSLEYLIDRAIVSRFYPPLGSQHYKLL